MRTPLFVEYEILNKPVDKIDLFSISIKKKILKIFIKPRSTPYYKFKKKLKHREIIVNK
jgi:hypothetical protein